MINFYCNNYSQCIIYLEFKFLKHFQITQIFKLNFLK